MPEASFSCWQLVLDVYLPRGVQLHPLQGGQQVSSHHRRQPLPLGLHLRIAVQTVSFVISTKHTHTHTHTSTTVMIMVHRMEDGDENGKVECALSPRAISVPEVSALSVGQH